MITRASIARHAQRSLQRQSSNAVASNQQRRCMAAVASGSFSYETGDANGVKFASRDMAGPTTTLALVAKAGTRYQVMPGFTEGLEKFAFKNTNKRSALRITRESELLGGELSASHTRETLILGAKFLRDDLPYFTELLGEVISNTKFNAYEFDELVFPNIKLSQKQHLGSTLDLALSSAHGIAFHHGLGAPLHPTSSSALTKYLSPERLAAYSQAAYSKPNIAIVANGADHQEFSNWVGQFFTDVPTSASSDLPAIPNTPSKYFGGEERIAHDSGNTVIIGFKGSSTFTSSSFKPELSVLAALLGGQSSVKWSAGFSLLAKSSLPYPTVHVSTTHATYSDAGLLYVCLTGSSSEQVAQATKQAVKTIKKVAEGDVKSEDIKKAIATAKFRALEAGQNIMAGLELTGSGLIQEGKPHQIDEVGKAMDGVTEEAVKKAAKSLFDSKATVSSVGDLYVLPWAEEMGLTV
ncbi:ubiquinol-cytochrome c reductase core subunit 1 [Agyrium rufum]|nr:ubiquinol-cytochrome c reductase core subunit 1 [Agyrium rufum]